MTFKDRDVKDKQPLEGKVRDSSVSRETDHNARVPLYKQKATDQFGNLDPNYRYRVVNDVPGRIHNFIRAGWEIAELDIQATYSAKNNAHKTQAGSGAWRTVNKGKDAECNDGVLMRILKDVWEQDNAAKAVERQAQIEDYDPTGQIKMAMNKAIRGNTQLSIDAFKK